MMASVVGLGSQSPDLHADLLSGCPHCLSGFTLCRTQEPEPNTGPGPSACWANCVPHCVLMELIVAVAKEETIVCILGELARASATSVMGRALCGEISRWQHGSRGG